MNNKRLQYLFMLMQLLGVDVNKAYDDLLSGDIQYYDDKIVQDAIWDLEIGLLKYISNPTDEELEICHQKYLEDLNKMNDGQKAYFQKYAEDLIINIGSKSQDSDGFQRTKEKENYE